MTDYNEVVEQFAPGVKLLIEKAFQTLLEKKHLYQSVEIQMADLSEFIEHLVQRRLDIENNQPMTSSSHMARMTFKSKEEIRDEYEKQTEGYLRRLPYFMPHEGNPNMLDTPHTPPMKSIVFRVPTVRTSCRNPKCGGLWPHNPCPASSFLIPTSDSRTDLHQIFLLRYQCQNCKKDPVTFLVKREGLKLTLCGRSPMEEIETPHFIPKQVVGFYRGAVLAFNCNAYLPALFMLRTTIEQHMRLAISAGDKNKKMSGDELADAYANILHPDFSSHNQSLKPVYASLSDAIHAAKDDGQLFESERTKVLAHFEAKEVFERLSRKT